MNSLVTSAKFYQFIALFLAMLLPGAWAQESQTDRLTLEWALSKARSNNPDLKMAQSSAQAASWKPWEALSAQLPHLNASATHIFSKKYQIININFGGAAVAIPTIFPSTTATLELSWTLFDGLKTWHAYQAARLQSQAANLELSRHAFLLDREVRLKFYQTLASQLLLNVAEQNVKTLEEHASQVSQLLKQGRATRFDALRVEVQLREAIPERISAKDRVDLSKHDLFISMGIPLNSMVIEGNLPIPQKDLVARIQDDNELSTRDDVQANIKRAEASDHQHDATLALWLPKISFTAQHTEYNNLTDRLIDTDSFRSAYAVGFLLTWNLFDGGSSFALRQQSAAMQAQAQANADALIQKAPYELDHWQRRYNYNVSLYEARRVAIEAAQESVRLAKLGQQAGTRTNTDVIDSELDLFRAKAGLVRAQIDAIEALIQLELATGKALL